MGQLFRRVLVTNDDGIDSVGINVLAEAIENLADEIWIIAPQQDQSGMAQSISINEPLRGRKLNERKWAIAGTPSDCVVLGLSHFMKENKPTLILSGINAGANVGDDVNLSGTLGAAFAGLMMGIPSIAVSLDFSSRKKIRWRTARTVVPELLVKLAQDKWSEDHCLSINLPDLPSEKILGMSWTVPAYKTIPSFRVEKREDLREKDYFWLYPRKNKISAPADSDIAALEGGRISISALKLDRSVFVKASDERR